MLTLSGILSHESSVAGTSMAKFHLVPTGMLSNHAQDVPEVSMDHGLHEWIQPTLSIPSWWTSVSGNDVGSDQFATTGVVYESVCFPQLNKPSSLAAFHEVRSPVPLHLFNFEVILLEFG